MNPIDYAIFYSGPSAIVNAIKGHGAIYLNSGKCMGLWPKGVWKENGDEYYLL